MGKIARCVAALAVVTVGCSFDSSGSSDTNQLGSSMGASATGTGDTDGSTGGDTAAEGEGEGSTSFVAGSTSVGNDEACVDVCAPSIPGGWSGPFYVADAANPIECPVGFARQDLGFTGLTAQSPSCDCMCDSVPGTCNVGYRLALAGCFAGLEGSVQNGECDDFSALGTDVHMRAELNGAPTACTANILPDVPEATWQTASTFCAAPARGGDCGSDVCIAGAPEGVATALCISSDGNMDCPGGDWTDRTVIYRSFDDQRTCTGCTCSGPTGCEVQVSAYDTGTCSGTPQNVPLNACTDLAVSGNYSVTASIDNGSCQPSTATPAGEATPSDAVTLCCAS